MLATFLLLLSLISTPVATPIVLDSTPVWVYPGGAAGVGVPVIDGDRAYVATDNGVVTAFNVEGGSIAWQSVTGETTEVGLMLADDAVFVPGSGGTLYVLDKGDGSERHAVSLSSTALTMPLASDDTVIVADRRGTVHLLASDTLAINHQVVLGNSIIGQGVVVDGKAIFSVSGGVVSAIDIESGDISWHAVLGASSSQPFMLSDGDIVTGSSDGVVTRLDANDGSIAWQTVMPTGRAVDFASSPAGLLVATSQGGVYALDPGTGGLIWSNVMRGDGVFATDECGDQCIMAVGKDTISTISTARGEINDVSVVTGGLTTDSVAAVDDVLVVVTDSGDVMLWRLSDD